MANKAVQSCTGMSPTDMSDSVNQHFMKPAGSPDLNPTQDSWMNNPQAPMQPEDRTEPQTVGGSGNTPH